jgi:hypothetical protein
MNGRLAALAEQAGYFIKFERTGSDVTVVYTKEPGTDGDLALFGELVVRECAEIFGQEETSRYEVDGNWIAKTIKQYFGIGVEE